MALTRIDANGVARADGELRDCRYGTLAVDQARSSFAVMKCDGDRLAYLAAKQDWRIVDMLAIGTKHR